VLEVTQIRVHLHVQTLNFVDVDLVFVLMIPLFVDLAELITLPIVVVIVLVVGRMVVVKVIVVYVIFNVLMEEQKIQQHVLVNAQTTGLEHCVMIAQSLVMIIKQIKQIA